MVNPSSNSHIDHIFFIGKQIIDTFIVSKLL